MYTLAFQSDVCEIMEKKLYLFWSKVINYVAISKEAREIKLKIIVETFVDKHLEYVVCKRKFVLSKGDFHLRDSQKSAIFGVTRDVQTKIKNKLDAM